MDKLWYEKHIGRFSFYISEFEAEEGDPRLAVTIGKRNSSLDLFKYTIGFMRY